VGKNISKNGESFFEAWRLATFKDGFIIGAFFSLVFQLGIIQVAEPFDRILVFSLSILGVAVGFYKPFARKSLISPPWDGTISGFGVILGLVTLLKTYVIPVLFP
jgi:hypothetical protein